MKIVILIVFIIFLLYFTRSVETYQENVGILWSKGWPMYLGVDEKIVDIPQTYYDNKNYEEKISSQLDSKSDYVWLTNDFNLNAQYDFLDSKLQRPITIVSGDGDQCIPDDLDPAIFERLINNSFVKEWYAQNKGSSTEPKLKFLPIGVDFHFPHPDTKDYKEGIKQLEKTRDDADDSARKLKIFSDCHLHNSDGRYGSNRAIINGLGYDTMEYQNGRVPRLELWKKYTEYIFGVSAHGNGLDCHRTWEMLYLGMIVIVKTSSLDEMYKDLPVVIVNDWSELKSQENLEKWSREYSKLTSKEYVWSKLRPENYINYI